MFLMKPSLNVRDRKWAAFCVRRVSQSVGAAPAVACPLASPSTIVAASRFTVITRGCRNTLLSLRTELLDGDGDGRLKLSTWIISSNFMMIVQYATVTNILLYIVVFKLKT